MLLISGIDWFVKGGWAMYPIALLSIYSLFVMFNRGFFFASRIRRTDAELENVLRGTALLPERLEGDLAPLLARGMKDGRFDRHSAELAVEREMLEATRYLNSLDTVSSVAPMFGLLGTITGLVQAFQVIAELQGAVNPSVLANGIWEALLTTVFGLLVGIPALVAYRYFRSRLIRWESHLHTVVDDAAQLAAEVRGGA